MLSRQQQYFRKKLIVVDGKYVHTKIYFLILVDKTLSDRCWGTGLLAPMCCISHPLCVLRGLKLQLWAHYSTAVLVIPETSQLFPRPGLDSYRLTCLPDLSSPLLVWHCWHFTYPCSVLTDMSGLILRVAVENILMNSNSTLQVHLSNWTGRQKKQDNKVVSTSNLDLFKIIEHLTTFKGFCHSIQNLLKYIGETCF